MLSYISKYFFLLRNRYIHVSSEMYYNEILICALQKKEGVRLPPFLVKPIHGNMR